MIGTLSGTCVSCEALPLGGGFLATVERGPYGEHIGYEVRIAEPLKEDAMTGRLWVRLVIREDAHLLYGFKTKAQRALFDKLLSVQRVGPKVALALVGGMTTAELAVAVARGDVARLAKVKGVGKKTAAGICLALEKSLLALVGVTPGEAEDAVDVGTKGTKLAQAERDLRAALGKDLGFTPDEVRAAVELTKNLLAGGDLEGALRAALRGKGTTR